MTSADDSVERTFAAKAHYDQALASYLDQTRVIAGRNRHLPPEATWADLATLLPDDIAGNGGVDFALGLLASALVLVVDREGPR